ncbi:MULTISPECIES: hypothetical protein [unclassified Nocardioides]|uniref:hypothetical protein n=1 Tax=unclassified Nocardioides TaxID=2615069 RepID=UPI0011505D3C|nr:MULTISPECIES: hypothetical protein [unclassified Nocardioides]TQK72363.1 hypothetical protein FBY23_4174 [Nocardioides sp. SLBN-35]WGY03429.1 hypothetical protein QI633_06615 [Nocardioides sp. QY071]
MSRTKVAALSSAGTAVVVLLLVTLAWGGLKLLDGLGREELWTDCDTDPTLSGLQGYCVVVSRYPATPVRSERTHLEITAVHDGAENDYRFVAAYPFLDSEAGSPLEVDWSSVDQRVVVTDPRTGSTITYTAEQYAGGR